MIASLSPTTFSLSQDDSIRGVVGWADVYHGDDGRSHERHWREPILRRSSGFLGRTGPPDGIRIAPDQGGRAKGGSTALRERERAGNEGHLGPAAGCPKSYEEFIEFSEHHALIRKSSIVCFFLIITCIGI